VLVPKAHENIFALQNLIRDKADFSCRPVSLYHPVKVEFFKKNLGHIQQSTGSSDKVLKIFNRISATGSTS